MRQPGYIAPPLRVVVLTEQEHGLVCHIMRAGLERGFIGNPVTRDLLANLEAARSVPARRRTEGWLSRWWPRGASTRTVRREP